MRFPARGDDTHTQAGDPVYPGGEAGSPEITPVALVRHGAAGEDALARQASGYVFTAHSPHAASAASAAAGSALSR
jgi:hypothetical protein